MGTLGTDFIIRYLSDFSDAIKGAKQLETLNKSIANTIGASYATATRVIGEDFNKIGTKRIKIDGKSATATVEQLGTVIQMADGNFNRFTETVTKYDNKILSVTGSLNGVTNQFSKTNVETAKAAKWFSTLKDNMISLGARALLTIPIWIALRGAIMGVFSGISGGIKDLIAFDLALQKIRNNLQGTPAQVASDFKKMRSSITEASKATGISTEELARAVKEFATLGFTANEALQGALGASKLSVALFGDAGETAGAFARALNIMIDRSLSAKSAIDQMNEAFALTSQLEETNNFEIKNVTEALDKFAGTAAGVGLTMNQTLSILAAVGTAGRAGSEGATLLSTSFNQLLTNIPKISKVLGIVVGAGDSTFDTFMKILNAVTNLNNTPGGEPAAVKAIGDIFGGAKGQKIIQSLIAVKDILDKNIATIPQMSKLNEKSTRTMETESGQAKILGNSLKELSKAFMTAVMGSEDFTGALIKLVNVVKGIEAIFKPLGTTINSVFSNLGFIAGAAFLLNWQKIISIQALISVLLRSRVAFAASGATLGRIFSGTFFASSLVGFATVSSSILLAFTRGGIVQGFKVFGAVLSRSLIAGMGVATLGSAIGGIFSAAVAAVFSPITIIAGIIGKLAGDALTDNYIKAIKDKSDKAAQVMKKIIDGLKGQLSAIDLEVLIKDLTLKQKPGDNEILRQIAALRKQLQKQVEAIKLQANIEVEPLVSFSDRQQIAKLILANQLDQLKLQGALNSELLKEEELRSRQLGIEEDAITKLKRKLDYEKAIKDEKRLQNKIGSDSEKLYDIAKKEGTEVARQIGDVISGEMDLDIFMRRGGKAAEIFTQEFGDKLKQAQMQQFFKGERVTGESELRGGTRIAIQEEAIRKQVPIYSTQAAIAQQKAEIDFQEISKVNDIEIKNPTNITIWTSTPIEEKGANTITNETINDAFNVKAKQVEATLNNKIFSITQLNATRPILPIDKTLNKINPTLNTLNNPPMQDRNILTNTTPVPQVQSGEMVISFGGVTFVVPPGTTEEQAIAMEQMLAKKIETPGSKVQKALITFTQGKQGTSM